MFSLSFGKEYVQNRREMGTKYLKFGTQNGETLAYKEGATAEELTGIMAYLLKREKGACLKGG